VTTFRVLVLVCGLLLGSLSLIQQASAAPSVSAPESELVFAPSDAYRSEVLFATSGYVNGCSYQAYLYADSSLKRVTFSGSWSCGYSARYSTVKYKLYAFQGSYILGTRSGYDTGSGSTIMHFACQNSTSREYTAALDVTIGGALRHVYSSRYLSFWCK
jgi:hypothetical protein